MATFPLLVLFSSGKRTFLCFDSGNQAKGLLLHLLYLRRMLKEQLPIRMLFKELLQQIILKQLIKRIRMLRVLLF